MPDKYFTTPDNKTIYINNDDFLIFSEIMLAEAAKKRAMDELKRRGMFDAVSSISAFSKDMVTLYTVHAPDDFKLAQFCYNEFMRILPESKPL